MLLCQAAGTPSRKLLVSFLGTSRLQSTHLEEFFLSIASDFVPLSASLCKVEARETSFNSSVCGGVKVFEFSINMGIY